MPSDVLMTSAARLHLEPACHRVERDGEQEDEAGVGRGARPVVTVATPGVGTSPKREEGRDAAAWTGGLVTNGDLYGARAN